MKLAITIKGITDIEPQDVNKIRFAFMDGPEEVVIDSYTQMINKVAKELDLDPNHVTISLDIMEDDEE